MQKVEMEHDVQDSWLNKPQPWFFQSAITVQAALIPTSNSDLNTFSFQLRQENPNFDAFTDSLIAPLFLDFMHKFELVQDAQDSWLRGPQPYFFHSAITDQATWIATSNSNQNKHTNQKYIKNS
jgi:hypothetical protein